MELAVKHHQGRIAQIEITGGHGMPDIEVRVGAHTQDACLQIKNVSFLSKRVATGRSVVCSLSPHVWREEGSI